LFACYYYNNIESVYRISRTTFDSLVARLEDDPIFQSSGCKPQHPVKFQLAAFLRRYGLCGSDSLQVAKELGIGFGTVFLYCTRVIKALQRLGLKAVSWGDNQQHYVTEQYIQQNYGIPGVLGIVDGTLIQLTAAPSQANRGVVYLCRKKFPTVRCSIHTYTIV
jgi:hypothetical protein